MTAKADERAFVDYDRMAGYGSAPTLERPRYDACAQRFVISSCLDDRLLARSRCDGGAMLCPAHVGQIGTRARLPRGLDSRYWPCICAEPDLEYERMSVRKRIGKGTAGAVSDVSGGQAGRRARRSGRTRVVRIRKVGRFRLFPWGARSIADAGSERAGGIGDVCRIALDPSVARCALRRGSRTTAARRGHTRSADRGCGRYAAV
jgi:hypothetical protein